MNKVIIFLRSILEFFVLIFIYLFIASLLYYFEVLPLSVMNVINYVFILLLCFVLGFRVARKIESKGYLNGFLFGVIVCIIFLLFSLINNDFEANSLIYFSTLIVSSIVGGIAGVPKNIEKK